MTRKAHPDYHRMMMDPASHPTATRRPKYEETRLSHLYKLGNEVLKVRKSSTVFANLAIKEVYAQEALALGRRWAPAAYLGIVPITENNGAFALGGNGTPVDYAVRMVQLADHQFADYLTEHGKLNPAVVGRVARFLAQKHAEEAASEQQTAEYGRPEYLAGLVEEVFYQAKKYFGQALTPAMYELITLPMNHFLEHHRKTLLRRQKKRRIVRVHGAFWPQHVYIKQQDVEAISPLESPRKLRVLDAASDVAQFADGLLLLGAAEEAASFVQRYAAAAKDRELEAVLPAYQVYHAARQGLLDCEWLGDLPETDDRRPAVMERAAQWFGLAVEVARTLPK